jgi:hypothetical protein
MLHTNLIMQGVKKNLMCPTPLAKRASIPFIVYSRMHLKKLLKYLFLLIRMAVINKSRHT